MGNKNIDSGDFGLPNRINNANGVNPEDIWESLVLDNEIPLRAKISL
jgi:hypothetical protein